MSRSNVKGLNKNDMLFCMNLIKKSTYTFQDTAPSPAAGNLVVALSVETAFFPAFLEMKNLETLFLIENGGLKTHCTALNISVYLPCIYYIPGKIQI